MKSVMDDMDPNERQALKDGTRKRKAPVEDQQTYGQDKNLQRKKVNAQSGPKPGADDDGGDPYQEMRQLVQQRAQRNQRARRQAIEDSDEESEDDESFDESEIFGADDDSI
jgi:hypothetical protein